MKVAWVLGWAVACSTLLMAEQRSAPRGRGAAAADAVKLTCAADLGTGVKSKRSFCDVLIGTAPADSVAVTIPAQKVPSTLSLDLHNRFTVPAAVPGPPVLAWARHEATIAVVSAAGDVLGRALVEREFRTADDLFDQIGGGARPGGVKGVAPGPPEAARFTIPAGVTTVGIVGTRLRVMTRVVGEQTFETPGRPVAIVSDIQLEFRR